MSRSLFFIKSKNFLSLKIFLKDKLEKAYEFMKQFVIGGINLLEKFMEWIGEKVKDVERGR